MGRIWGLICLVFLGYTMMYIASSPISFSYISGPTQVRMLSAQEFEMAKGSTTILEKDYSRMFCGNQHMKHTHFSDQWNHTITSDSFQSSCQITQCDMPSVRDGYNLTGTFGVTLEFWVNSRLPVSVAENIPAVVAFINQKYSSFGIRFKAVQYSFTPSISGTYYVNDPCNTDYSQPCYPGNTLLSSVIQQSGLRSTIKTNGTLAILVDNIQRPGPSQLILGYSFFPWTNQHGMMVLAPETVRPGDITAPHEIGHFLGLYHTLFVSNFAELFFFHLINI